MQGRSNLKVFIIVLILSCIGSISFGCGGSKNSAANINSVQKLNDLVEEGDFLIENSWAYPVRGSQINLIGNPNYIRIFSDSISLYLPYFGVRHNSGFNRSGAIKYDGPAREFKIINKNDRISLEFEGNDGSENYQFFINIFANGTANTSVNSSQRETISYRGNITRSNKD